MISICYNTCAAAGWPIFGLEYTSQYYCDDALQAGSDAARETDYAIAYSGDSTDLCGSPNRLNMYSTS